MKLDKQLDRIRAAYDLTVKQWDHGIDPLTDVPDDLKNSPEFGTFLRESGRWCNSGALENREFLVPRQGMLFLDIGCGASLRNYAFHEWPSTYYGIDISPALIGAMRKFIAKHGMTIGGLFNTDASDLPFEDDFFEIAAVIGVLEYWSLCYVEAALIELNRVLKPGGRVVLDVPNMEHAHVDLMFRLEECLGRPSVAHARSQVEDLLTTLFTIERTNDSHVMLKYFCRTPD